MDTMYLICLIASNTPVGYAVSGVEVTTGDEIGAAVAACFSQLPGADLHVIQSVDAVVTKSSARRLLNGETHQITIHTQLGSFGPWPLHQTLVPVVGELREVESVKSTIPSFVELFSTAYVGSFN